MPSAPEIPDRSVRAAILAGGASSRMGGRPKGLLELGGERILDRLIRRCQAAFGSDPLLVANAPEAPGWAPGLRVVADARPGTATLGGLYTAVLEAPAPVVCVAWDMPFVTEPFLARLARGLERFDAFLPESDGRRGVEPLCAAYGPGCLEPMASALDREDFRAIAFHRDVRLGILPLAEVASFGIPDQLFFNVNTPDELERARQIDGRPPA
jgi:molybdopterin-guanine dinucleotide biosynthesis protein A